MEKLRDCINTRCSNETNHNNTSRYCFDCEYRQREDKQHTQIESQVEFGITYDSNGEPLSIDGIGLSEDEALELQDINS